MRSSRSHVALLLAVIVLAWISEQPRVTAAEPFRATARWVTSDKPSNREYLDIQVDAPAEYVNKLCKVVVRFDSARAIPAFENQRRIPRSKRLKFKMGNVAHARIADGQWHVRIEIISSLGAVLAKTQLKAPKGNPAEARDKERKWLATQYQRLQEITKELPKTAKPLYAKQKNTNPETDWQLTSPWVREVTAWVGTHQANIGEIEAEWGKRYGFNSMSSGTFYGLHFPHSILKFRTALKLTRSLSNQYFSDLSWGEIRMEETGGGPQGWQHSDADLKKPPEKRNENRPKRTYESAMRHRKQMIARGFKSYDFEAQIKLALTKLESELNVNKRYIGELDDCNIGVAYQDFDRILTLSTEMAQSYEKLKAGPPDAQLRANQWFDWPSEWTTRIEAIRNSIKKYEDPKNKTGPARQYNILAQNPNILTHIKASIALVEKLRFVYLAELYKTHNVPKAKRAPLQLAGITIKKGQTDLTELIDAIEAFFETQRGLRREQFEALYKEFQVLGARLEQNLDNPKKFFKPRATNTWLRQWDERVAKAAIRIRWANDYKDAGTLFFPNAAEHLRQSHRQLVSLRAIALQMEAHPGETPIDRNRLEAQIRDGRSAFNAAMKAMELELQRKKIDSPLSQMGHEYQTTE